MPMVRVGMYVYMYSAMYGWEGRQQMGFLVGSFQRGGE